MITLKELKDFNEKFYNYVDSTFENDKVFDKYDKYYKWIQSQLEQTKDPVMVDSFYSVMFRLISNLTRWFEIRGIKAKDISKKWDKVMVGRTGSICDEFKERSAKGTLSDSSYKIKLHFILKDLLEHNDVATVAFCFKLLQNTYGDFSLNEWAIQYGTHLMQLQTEEVLAD